MVENTENGATHVVAKPFNTASRRFAIGTPITEGDVPADNPIPWDDLKAGRFVVGAETKAAERAAEQAGTTGATGEAVGGTGAIDETGPAVDESRRRAAR